MLSAMSRLVGPRSRPSEVEAGGSSEAAKMSVTTAARSVVPEDEHAPPASTRSTEIATDRAAAALARIRKCSSRRPSDCCRVNRRQSTRSCRARARRRADVDRSLGVGQRRRRSQPRPQGLVQPDHEGSGDDVAHRDRRIRQRAPRVEGAAARPINSSPAHASDGQSRTPRARSCSVPGQGLEVVDGRRSVGSSRQENRALSLRNVPWAATSARSAPSSAAKTRSAGAVVRQPTSVRIAAAEFGDLGFRIRRPRTGSERHFGVTTVGIGPASNPLGPVPEGGGGFHRDGQPVQDGNSDQGRRERTHGNQRQVASGDVGLEGLEAAARLPAAWARLARAAFVTPASHRRWPPGGGRTAGGATPTPPPPSVPALAALAVRPPPRRRAAPRRARPAQPRSEPSATCTCVQTGWRGSGTGPLPAPDRPRRRTASSRRRLGGTGGHVRVTPRRRRLGPALPDTCPHRRGEVADELSVRRRPDPPEVQRPCTPPLGPCSTRSGRLSSTASRRPRLARSVAWADEWARNSGGTQDGPMGLKHTHSAKRCTQRPARSPSARRIRATPCRDPGPQMRRPPAVGHPCLGQLAAGLLDPARTQCQLGGDRL